MIEFLVIAFLAVVALGTIGQEMEKSRIKSLEDENRELINVALKHYNKTKGNG